MTDASPRFRQDLAISPVEADGVACVDVRDPRSGNSFRLYDFEYQLALQLNGQGVGDVVRWASDTYGAELTAEGVNEFAARLRELGFLESDAVVLPAPVPQAASAAATLEVAIPSLPAGDDALDSAAEEWMSPQAAKTAQFVPDAAMLGAHEPTPVAPMPLRASGPQKTFDKPLDGPAAIEAAPDGELAGGETVPVSLDELDGAGSAPPSLGAPPKAPRATPSSWAVELDGHLQSSESPPAVKDEPPPVKPPIVLDPLPTVAPPPTGLPERRQPPRPDAVEMGAFSETPSPDAAPRKSRAPLIILVLALAAAAAGLWYWKTQRPAAAPQAVRVHVLTPAPAAVYRWFDRPGQVTGAEVIALTVATPGRLTELLPSGTDVAAGEVVGKLQGAAPVETALEHHRSRVGFYKQVRDAMRAAGNATAAHHAEVMLAEKERLVAEAQAALARYTVVASEPGEIIETLAKVGTPVAPGVPVARVKSRLLRGAFQLDPAEEGAFARLNFCRVEVIGLAPRASNDPIRRAGPPATAADSSPLEAQVGPRFVDCERSRTAGGQVQVALPGDVGLVSGQPLRLARRRFEAVFPIPASALLGEGDRRSVWLASRDGATEERPVTLADAGDEALVSDGLRVGDRVIVDPPAELQPGTRIAIDP